MEERTGLIVVVGGERATFWDRGRQEGVEYVVVGSNIEITKSGAPSVVDG